MPVQAFVVPRTETEGEDGVSEGREGIALITQRVADNVRILFRCVLILVFCFIDLGVG